MSLPFSIFELTAVVNDSSREAEFLRLLAASYRDVFSLVLAIVGKRNDAEDVIQDVCVLLWQKYDDFESGTSFRKWACAIAFHVAKAYVRKERRRRGVGLSDEALARIAQFRSAGTELFELRRDVLRQCLSKLKTTDRKLLSECYQSPTSLVNYAERQGQTVSAIYSKLKRIRRLLSECAQRYLSHGED